MTTKPRLTIRQATADDLPWLRYLIDKFRHEPSQASAYPVFDDEELDTFTLACLRALPQTTRFAVFLAWHGKKAIGLLAGEITERAVGKPHRYCNAPFQYVEPAYRGADVGYRLVEALAEWAQGLGCTMFEFRSLPDDARFAAQGYRQIAVDYAAPIQQVLDTWRANAYPLPATPQVEQKEAVG